MQTSIQCGWSNWHGGWFGSPPPKQQGSPVLGSFGGQSELQLRSGATAESCTTAKSAAAKSLEPARSAAVSGAVMGWSGVSGWLLQLVAYRRPRSTQRMSRTYHKGACRTYHKALLAKRRHQSGIRHQDAVVVSVGKDDSPSRRDRDAVRTYDTSRQHRSDGGRDPSLRRLGRSSVSPVKRLARRFASLAARCNDRLHIGCNLPVASRLYVPEI